MGILKVGPTFQSLTQHIHQIGNTSLDVARPKALAVIDTATRKAWELTEKVRNFIKENLHLWTEVLALELKNDGTLHGGIINGKDIFSEQIALKNKDPGVVVRTDSIPTLSFTSGSED